MCTSVLNPSSLGVSNGTVFYSDILKMGHCVADSSLSSCFMLYISRWLFNYSRRKVDDYLTAVGEKTCNLA